MPVDYNKYPPEWLAVRHEILRRAGGRPDDPRIGARCEHCGVQNYTVGYRDIGGDFIPAGRGIPYYDDLTYTDSYRNARQVADLMNAWETGPDRRPVETIMDIQGINPDRRYIVIVLTIAHLEDPDPANVSPDNLAALCQACHNRLDREMRRVHANQTRYERRLTAGQLEMQL